MAILVGKINDGMGFKDNFGSKPNIPHTKKKIEYWGVHVEIVKSQ